MRRSVDGEGVVMGLWGHFLPYWEVSAEVQHGCRRGRGVGVEATGGPWDFSRG